MTDIYDQHRTAFANVAAYVILDSNKERVATIAFKFPKDGAGRLYAYVHWFGTAMVRGYAGGFGYDKQSAACANAASKMTAPDVAKTCDNGTHARFISNLANDNGYKWDSRLRDAGFTVLCAV